MEWLLGDEVVSAVELEYGFSRVITFVFIGAAMEWLLGDENV
jgi:hypothetical protein